MNAKYEWSVKLDGFAAVVARCRVQQEWHKPLLGKPFIRYGQCLFMASYFFALGGVLGSRYRDSVEDFACAFLNLHGEEPGSVSRYFAEYAEAMLPRIGECSSILDYVTRVQSEVLHFQGNHSGMLLQLGTQKVKPDIAAQMLWNFAQDGAVFGAIHPDRFRVLWEEMYKRQDERSWRLAHASGLDIPEQQDVMTYDEAEQGEVESFLDYCQQCAPSLYVSLSSA